MKGLTVPAAYRKALVTLPNAWVRAGAGPRWAGGTGDTVRTPRQKIRGARIMLTAVPVGAPG
ncbi:hypothetical protein ACFRCI_12035 [Streptomyces sp. NPDC056638]|uniref:hypothetical protein n=1 Tax=Streptomyces sp. NPDC056638 TaxID=3345887 RepID=UPI0036ACC429